MAAEYLIDGATNFAAASWVIAAGTAGAGPAANATLNITSGQQTINVNVDQSASTFNRSLEINKGFTGVGGSVSAPIVLYLNDNSTAAEKTSANTEGYLRYTAGGGAWYHSCGLVSATSSVDNVFIDTGGKFFCVGGLYGWVHVTSGALEVQAAAIVTNIEVWGGGGTAFAQTSGTNFTNLTIYSGNFVSARAITGTVNIFGGTLTLNYIGTTATGTVNQYGGIFSHQGGDITTYNHNAGTHDTTQMGRKCTITTRTRKPLAKYQGIAAGSGNLTVTNEVTIGFPSFAA